MDPQSSSYIPQTPPTIPALSLPANGATGISTYPSLSWNASSGATNYTLQVSTSNTFGSFVYNQSGLTSANRVINGLSYSNTYYWRVNATNSYGVSGWSNVWSFSTGVFPITIDWISIPVGNFTMGSDTSDPGCYNHETPKHTVYLDAFQISKYEITNAQYKSFIDYGGYNNSAYWTTEGWSWRTSNNITEPYYWSSGQYNSGPSFPNHPVVGVSWYEAYAFCMWAGSNLPTEAQWEKAARGTSANNYWPWGSIWDASKCNSWENSTPDTFNYSSPVGYFSAGQSPYGVYDMAGNVYEWVNDWYQSNYYSSSPSINPTGPTSGTLHVIRSGSYVNNYMIDRSCRCALRYYGTPSDRNAIIGIRITR